MLLRLALRSNVSRTGAACRASAWFSASADASRASPSAGADAMSGAVGVVKS